MTEYTVHFQKGVRVGTRSLRMVTVVAENGKMAVKLAKAIFNAPGYKMVRVDYFEAETGRLIRVFDA